MNLIKNTVMCIKVSLNIIRKYCGPIDIWLSILSAKRHGSKVIIINEQPLKSYEAMSQHLSQWVWYVNLYLHDECKHVITTVCSLFFCECAGLESFSFRFQAIHTRIHFKGSALESDLEEDTVLVKLIE